MLISLLRNSKLASEDVEILNRAFKEVLRKLYLVDRNDPVCEIVARKVIEIAESGVHDPQMIADAAVKQLLP
jgi:hypothetical protein